MENKIIDSDSPRLIAEVMLEMASQVNEMRGIAQSLEMDLDRHKDELKKGNREIISLTDKLLGFSKEKGILDKRIHELEQSLEISNGQLGDRNRDLKVCDENIRDKNAEIKTLKEKVKSLEQDNGQGIKDIVDYQRMAERQFSAYEMAVEALFVHFKVKKGTKVYKRTREIIGNPKIAKG